MTMRHALLSSLAGIQLGQGVAVTGSVFDACRQCGLTGHQGILIATTWQPPSALHPTTR